MKVKKFVRIFLVVILMCSTLVPTNTIAAKQKVYTISVKSKPADKAMLKYSTYNKYTKDWYLIRSYLELLEKKGGGTLVLKKGTYKIPKTLYVPSNVTIKLKNGVQIIKTQKTGTKKIKSSNSIFQLIRPSKGAKKKVYGGYKGEKNISIIGEGNATINMKYVKDSIAIVGGHNRNITIQNITFKNMKSGHFIEMDATKGAVISNNKFMNSKASSTKNKEAINLDTPDQTTKGWGHPWSKYDKTPNKNILIEDNYFYNLDRAIGTHKYSGGKYHSNITIKNNYIEKTRQDAIRVMNWSNAVIENNIIKNVAKVKGTYRGIFASGAKNPTFRNNTFEKVARPIQFMPWKNNGPGSKYKVTYNKISNSNMKDLQTNKVSNTIEDFIRINTVYNVFDRETIKLPLD